MKKFLLIAAIAVALAGCGEKEGDTQTDDPKDQSTPIIGLFGGNYTATVKGHFTNAQWNGVPNKVKSLLDAGYGATPGMGQGGLKTYFENNAVVIIVESTTEYTKYKTVETESAVIYFNLSALDDVLTGDDVRYAFTAMRTNSSESV